MLRYSFGCLFLLALAGQARASWADAMFDELSRDFGSVPHGQTQVHPFRLVNNTGSTVRISSIRVSCGCTSARALTSVLAPGQETAVVATMNTSRFYNAKNVTIFVTFDKPHFEEVRLWVQANSRDDVAFSSDGISFGKVKRGAAPVSKVTVTLLGDAKTQVLEAKSESNYVAPTLKEISRAAGEVIYEISANVRPDTPAGKWYTDIWLKTNNPNMPKLRVPVTIEIEAALSVNPNTVTLGQVKAGTELDRKVILRGVTPFRITGITGTDTQIRVIENSSESKTVHVLTVTLNPMEAGQLTRMIRIHTDLQNGGDIEFNAQAEVVP
jgi:Protein of unknown function (DUF1573)